MPNSFNFEVLYVPWRGQSVGDGRLEPPINSSSVEIKPLTVSHIKLKKVDIPSASCVCVSTFKN